MDAAQMHLAQNDDEAPRKSKARAPKTHTLPEPGTVCKVRGERGEFAFRSASFSANGEESWTLISRRTGQLHSYRPERIRIQRNRGGKPKIREWRIGR